MPQLRPHLMASACQVRRPHFGQRLIQRDAKVFGNLFQFDARIFRQNLPMFDAGNCRTGNASLGLHIAVSRFTIWAWSAVVCENPLGHRGLPIVAPLSLSVSKIRCLATAENATVHAMAR